MFQFYTKITSDISTESVYTQSHDAEYSNTGLVSVKANEVLGEVFMIPHLCARINTCTFWNEHLFTRRYLENGDTFS